MQFFKFVVLGLLGTACAAQPLEAAVPEKRSLSTVETDISTISTELTKLKTALTAYTGTLTQSLKMLTIFNDLADDITAGTTAVKAISTQSAANSATVYTKVKALATKYENVLAEARAKKSVFTSAGYSSYVSEYLTPLKKDTVQFYTAVHNKVSSGYKTKVNALKTAVTKAFTTTINDF